MSKITCAGVTADPITDVVTQRCRIANASVGGLDSSPGGGILSQSITNVVFRRGVALVQCRCGNVVRAGVVRLLSSSFKSDSSQIASLHDRREFQVFLNADMWYIDGLRDGHTVCMTVRAVN